jgi:mRNA interferase YafQ
VNLKRHKSFVRDMAKVKLSDSQFAKFISYLGLLKDNQELPKEAKNHKLNGEWKDFSEFHLGGDMLIIYLKNSDESITLVRMGTHSQLFR